jgi:hypothetical protein
MRKDVSDGCIYHVLLTVDPQLILAANTVKTYQLLSRVIELEVNSPEYMLAAQAEMDEGVKVDAARAELVKLLDIGMHALCSAEKIPELIGNDPLELRLQQCRKEVEHA